MKKGGTNSRPHALQGTQVKQSPSFTLDLAALPPTVSAAEFAIILKKRVYKKKLFLKWLLDLFP